jgi:hypothetical protein
MMTTSAHLMNVNFDYNDNDIDNGNDNGNDAVISNGTELIGGSEAVGSLQKENVNHAMGDSSTNVAQPANDHEDSLPLNSIVVGRHDDHGPRSTMNDDDDANGSGVIMGRVGQQYALINKNGQANKVSAWRMVAIVTLLSIGIIVGIVIGSGFSIDSSDQAPSVSSHTRLTQMVQSSNHHSC